MDKISESLIINKKGYIIKAKNKKLFDTKWDLSIRDFLLIFVPFLTLITFSLSFADGYFSYFLIFILLGIYFHKLTILLHDLSHMRFFPSRRLNKLAGNLVAWICFTDFNSYRNSHKIHHLKTGQKDDSEIHSVFKNTSARSKIIYLGSHIIGLGVFFTSKSRISNISRFSLTAILLTQALIFFLLANSGNFFHGFLWFISSSSIGLFFSRLRGLLEHCPIKENSEITTRSHHCSIVEEFIFYGNNMNFHLEHHLDPGVPTYHLKKFSKLVNPFINRKAISRSPVLTLSKIARINYE